MGLVLTGAQLLSVPLHAAPLAGARAPVGWRMDGTGNFPLAHPPTAWSATQHVLWSTPMPAWSNSSPILLGDRLYVSSEPDTLLCLSATDGRILWQRPNPIADAVRARVSGQPILKQTGAPGAAKPSLAQQEYQLTQYRQLLRKTPNPELERKARALKTEIAALRLEVASMAATSKPPAVHEANGYSTPTPTSDGALVYALFGTGVVAAYDVDGRRRWITFVDRPVVANGSSASPVLAGGKLLVLMNDLIALDAATGEVEWRVNVSSRPGTPVALRIDGQDVVVLPGGRCVRVADGVILATELGDLDYNSPLVHDRVLYMIQGSAQAFEIPDKTADALEFKPLWTSKLKGERYYSSPVFADGLIYAITRNQILHVLDAKTGEVVYVKPLELGSTAGIDSVYTSLTQAGPYVFVSGFEGATAVLRSGRQFEQVAMNQLTPFRSNPIFDGDRMYVRAHDKFYCISAGTTAGAAAPSDARPTP